MNNVQTIESQIKYHTGQIEVMTKWVKKQREAKRMSASDARYLKLQIEDHKRTLRDLLAIAK